jgi:hypothetical protein
MDVFPFLPPFAALYCNREGGDDVTTRTRHYIDLEDLLGLRFECEKCKTSIDVSLGQVNAIPQRCPICDRHWMSPNRGDMNGDQIHSLITSFLADFKSLRNAANNETSPRDFGISLEIAGSTPVKTS